MTSPISPRLRRAFARHHIALDRHGSVWSVRRGHDDARILLPDGFELEEKAVRQLLDFAGVGWLDRPKPVRCACATPDFHPGALAPVGSIVATEPDVVVPAAVGTDINCGMRLITLGTSLKTLAHHESSWLPQLSQRLLHVRTDVPVPSRSFRVLFDEGPDAFLDGIETRLGGVWGGTDSARLRREVNACVGLDGFQSASQHAPDFLVDGRAMVRPADLGTVGAGNHFVEFQEVEAVLDRHVAHAAGLRVGDAVAMIHSGSRDVGFHVGHRWVANARAAWPEGVRHPGSGLYALQGARAEEYLVAQGTAARYAWLNRVVLAEWVREALEAVPGTSSSRLVVDVPHNVVLRENGLNVHRKGATPAHDGQWALLPGSMGDASYLVVGLGHPDWLASCSHGAGRRVRRQAMRRRVSAGAVSSWACVTLREERRLEEAPEAYKPIGPVVDVQEDAGLLRAAVRLRPWRTFKA